MSQTFKVAAAQMVCGTGEVEQNLRKAESLIRQAAKAGAVLVVLPELFDSGYRTEEQDRLMATTIPGATTEWMAAKCAELNIYLVAAIIEKDEEQLYDTAVLVGPAGLVGLYRKTGLWDKENDRFQKGKASYDAVYDIGFCKVGLQICYEIGFPENARILTFHGADIIAYPSAFGKARYYAWDLASRSRALENSNYVIACNRAGTEKGETVFGAASRIVGPQGNLLALAQSEGDEIILAELDLAQIKAQRETIPYLKDLQREAIAGYYRP